MLHAFNCLMSLALTYSMRRPTLARECAAAAMVQAIRMGRPDLTYAANALLGAL